MFSREVVERKRERKRGDKRVGLLQVEARAVYDHRHEDPPKSLRNRESSWVGLVWFWTGILSFNHIFSGFRVPVSGWAECISPTCRDERENVAEISTRRMKWVWAWSRSIWPFNISLCSRLILSSVDHSVSLLSFGPKIQVESPHSFNLITSGSSESY